MANRRGEVRPPRQRAWVRTPEPLGDDALTQAAGFAYCSDLFLLSAALPPHGRHIDSPGLQLASLDHTVWFHTPFRADEWHLYEQEGSWMAAVEDCRVGISSIGKATWWPAQPRKDCSASEPETHPFPEMHVAQVGVHFFAPEPRSLPHQREREINKLWSTCRRSDFVSYKGHTFSFAVPLRKV